jgi:hypothetical protein
MCCRLIDLWEHHRLSVVGGCFFRSEPDRGRSVFEEGSIVFEVILGILAIV